MKKTEAGLTGAGSFGDGKAWGRTGLGPERLEILDSSNKPLCSTLYCRL